MPQNVTSSDIQSYPTLFYLACVCVCALCSCGGCPGGADGAGPGGPGHRAPGDPGVWHMGLVPLPFHGALGQRKCAAVQVGMLKIGGNDLGSR